MAVPSALVDVALTSPTSLKTSDSLRTTLIGDTVKLRFRAFPGSPQVEAWWHGTNRPKAQKIISHGGLDSSLSRSFETGDSAPLEGRSYVTKSLVSALNYAVSRSRKMESEVYVFKFSNLQSKDLWLDEDVVLYYCGWVGHPFGSQDSDFCPLDDPRVLKLKTWVKEQLKDQYPYPPKASYVIELVPRIPHSITQPLIEASSLSGSLLGLLVPDTYFVVNKNKVQDVLKQIVRGGDRDSLLQTLFQGLAEHPFPKGI